MEAPVVQVFFNGRAVQSVPFEGEVLTIGRRKDNDIVLNNLSVSRHHATLRKLDRQIVLEDGGSENGCYVNGKKVRLAVLRSGDVIRIAKHQIVLRAAGDAAAVVDAEAPALKVLPAQRDLLDGAHTREIGADTRAMLLDAARPELPAPPAPVAVAAAAQPAGPPDAAESIFDLSDADFVVETGSQEAEAPTAGKREVAPVAPDTGATEVGLAPAVFPAEAENSAPALPVYAGLIVQSGGKLERVVSWDQPVLRVGRAADCDIVLPQAKVSRNHTHFTRDGDRYEVQDLGSVNFTFVNGEKITRHELRVGDIVQIGDFEFTFVIENQPIGREMRQPATQPRAAEAQTAPPATVVAGLTAAAPAAAAPAPPAALPESDVDVPEVLFGSDEEKDLEALEAQGADFPVPRDPSSAPGHARRSYAPEPRAAAPPLAPIADAAPPALPPLPEASPEPAAADTLFDVAPSDLGVFDPADPDLTQLAAPPAEVGIAPEPPADLSPVVPPVVVPITPDPAGQTSGDSTFDLAGAALADVEELTELSAATEVQSLDDAAEAASFDLSTPDFGAGAEELDAPTLFPGADDLDAALAEPSPLEAGALDVDDEVAVDASPADIEAPALDVDEDTFSDGRATEILLSDSLDVSDAEGTTSAVVSDADSTPELFAAAAPGEELGAGPEDDGGLVVLSDAGSALSVALSDDASLGDDLTAVAGPESSPDALVLETPAETLFGEAQAALGEDLAEASARGLELDVATPAPLVPLLCSEAPLLAPCHVATAADWVLPAVSPLAVAPECFEGVQASTGCADSFQPFQPPDLAAAALPFFGMPGGPGRVCVQSAPAEASAAAPLGVAVATALAERSEADGALADTVRFELRLRIDQFPEPLRRLLQGSDGQGLRVPFEIRLRTGKD